MYNQVIPPRLLEKNADWRVLKWQMRFLGGTLNVLIFGILAIVLVGMVRGDLVLRKQNKVYSVFGIYCDKKDAAEFIARNYNQSIARGDMMFYLQQGRTDAQRKMRARRGKFYKPLPIAMCQMGKWQVMMTRNMWQVRGWFTALETYVYTRVHVNFFGSMTKLDIGYVVTKN